MNKRLRRLLCWAVPSLGLGTLVWLGVESLYEPFPDLGDATEVSTDLKRDLKLMWETRRLRGTPDPSHGPNPRGSTPRAIEAAGRVFNTVELVGMTQAEVIALLGDPWNSSDSIYNNCPFWPPEEPALVYRFDSGAYGWQFDVLFDGD